MLGLDDTSKKQFINELNSACEKLKLSISSQQVESLILYLELLIKWNKAFNLTAIRKPHDMLVKHIIDSLSIAPFLTGHEILDVGTGPGLPGVPLAILFPEKSFVLIDSNGKKTRFITQSKITLGIDNITIINGRVEDLEASKPYDQIVSRAFTALDNMVNLCEHLLAKNGHFLAMKGQQQSDELASIPDKFHLEQSIQLQVPGCDEQRHLFIIGRSS